MSEVTDGLLPILSKVFGREAELLSEETQSDGQVKVNWRTIDPPNERALGRAPAILISADRKSLKWVGWLTDHVEPFTLDDLAAAAPADEANRHPSTVQLGKRLERSLRATGLVTPSGSAALVAALEERGLHTDSAAALASSATGQEFWGLRRHAKLAWRYRLREGSLYLTPPYSSEEEAAAQAVLSEDWFERALKENGRILFNGTLFLPVLSNDRAGLYTIREKADT